MDIMFYVYVFLSMLWAGLSLAVWKIHRLSSFLWPSAFVVCAFGLVHNLWIIGNTLYYRWPEVDIQPTTEMGIQLFWNLAIASYIAGSIRYRISIQQEG